MLKISKIKRIMLTVVLSLIALLLILAWPVYQAMAHKNKIAFLPFYQFIAIPKESPSQQKLYDPAYQVAGEQVLQLLPLLK